MQAGFPVIDGDSAIMPPVPPVETDVRPWVHDQPLPVAKPPVQEETVILGGSAELKNLLGKVRKVAASYNTTVLIRGESGTGKELIARRIHELSANRDGRFVAVNCAAIPEGLADSHLFGHERGAFSGAEERQRGCFELASAGTLFLDEVGDMPLTTQAKILRVLEDKSVTRVGGNNQVKFRGRVIAATHRNLGEMIKTGKFRLDLYFRLSVVELKTPALRDYPEDVGLLMSHYMQHFAQKYNRPSYRLTPKLLGSLKERHWKGNVRELRNMAERWVVLCAPKEGNALTPADVAEHMGER